MNYHSHTPSNGPRRDKTCLRGFRQSEFQTNPLSYIDYLENWNFTCSKFTYDIFQNAHNKGADHLRLCNSQITEDRFSRVKAQICLLLILFVTISTSPCPIKYSCYHTCKPLSYQCGYGIYFYHNSYTRPILKIQKVTSSIK